jgi:hypothetical protein
MRSLFFCLIVLLFFSPEFLASKEIQSDCFVVDYKTSVKIEKGKRILEKAITIQINNKKGDWISDVEIPYKYSVDIIEAVILNEFGQIERKLRKSDFITRSDISSDTFYEDSYVKEFKLQWHKYPYQIRYSYKTIFDQFLSVIDWTPTLYLNAPVLNASLSVQLPLDYDVSTHFSDSLDFKLDESLDFKHYQWKGAYLRQLTQESFSPHLKERLQKVTMVPKSFKYKIDGSFKSWESFGDWMYNINRGLDELSPSEKAIVDKMVVGIEDKHEIIRRLYAYMQQNTRYINIAIDDGGLVSYPAQYVCQNKYGDCKALTIYMKALLQYVGIPSYYTLIHAGSNPLNVVIDFPSQQFNHVILCVPVQQDTVWLENTSKQTPYNYLGTFTQNRYGFLINENKSRLVRTPTMTMEDVKEQNRYDFELSENGSGTLKIKQNLSGESFEKFKYIDIYLSERDKIEILNKSLPVRGVEPLSFEIKQEDAYKANLSIEATYQVTEQFRQVAKSMIIQPLPIFSIDIESRESRKSDIKINYPINKSDSIIYHLSFLDETQMKLPPEVELDSKFGKYEAKYLKHGQSIIATRHFQLYQGNYGIEEYPDFYDFLDSIKTTQNNSIIVLNPK